MGGQAKITGSKVTVSKQGHYALSSCCHNLGHWTFSGTCCLGDEITPFLFSPTVKQDLYSLPGSHKEQNRTMSCLWGVTLMNKPAILT